MTSRKKHQRNQHKRNPEQFIKVPHYIVRTFAWRCLTPADRATWLELAALYNGSNNGSIAASTRVLANRMNIGKSTVARALNNLETYGFIELVRRSTFQKNKDRTASEYRMTHQKCDVTNQPPKKHIYTHRKSFLRQSHQHHL